MLHKPFLRFFRTSNRDGGWQDLDLNQVEVLFTVSVGAVVTQKLAVGKVKDPSVQASRAPFEKHWIKPNLNLSPGAPPFKGGRLIALSPGVGTAKAPVVTNDLS